MRPVDDQFSTSDSLPHSPNHIDCPACEHLRQSTLSAGAFGRLTFREAAPLWLEDHRARIAESTAGDYRFYVQSLTKFFGDLTLSQVHIGHVKAYQAERAKSAGPTLVNQELNILKQVLNRAGLWADIKPFYHRLKQGKAKVGQAMEPQDEKKLFETAASNPMWKVAYWASLISAGTGADPGEIRHLHLDDIHIGGEMPSMRIRDGLKNVHRDRIVPLRDSRAALWALGQILKRYYRICRKLKIEPSGDHYVLLGRARRASESNAGRGSTYDPWKPMGSWRKSWTKLREAAGLPTLRRKDLRHHAITKLLENPDISEQTVEEIVGHVSERMKKRYSHIRHQPKIAALASIDIQVPRPPEPRPPASQEAIAELFDSFRAYEPPHLGSPQAVDAVENPEVKPRKPAIDAD